jgi:hypothetical protein
VCADGKEKSAVALFVYQRAFSIYNGPAVRNGRRDGAQGVSRELCGVALDTLK